MITDDNTRNDELLSSDAPNGNSSCAFKIRPIYSFCRTVNQSREVRGRQIKKPSDVVPDQTYTIRQLFERSVLNSMPTGLGRSYYAEDTTNIDSLMARSGIDLTQLDLTELDDYKEQLSNIIEYRKSQLKPKK